MQSEDLNCIKTLEMYSVWMMKRMIMLLNWKILRSKVIQFILPNVSELMKLDCYHLVIFLWPQHISMFFFQDPGYLIKSSEILFKNYYFRPGSVIPSSSRHLSSIVKITSKKRQPEIITFKVKHDPIGLCCQAPSQIFLGFYLLVCSTMYTYYYNCQRIEPGAWQFN